MEYLGHQVHEESPGLLVKWASQSKETAEKMGHLDFMEHLESQELLAFQETQDQKELRDRPYTGPQEYLDEMVSLASLVNPEREEMLDCLAKRVIQVKVET